MKPTSLNSPPAAALPATVLRVPSLTQADKLACLWVCRTRRADGTVIAPPRCLAMELGETRSSARRHPRNQADRSLIRLRRRLRQRMAEYRLPASGERPPLVATPYEGRPLCHHLGPPSLPVHQAGTAEWTGTRSTFWPAEPWQRAGKSQRQRAPLRLARPVAQTAPVARDQRPHRCPGRCRSPPLLDDASGPGDRVPYKQLLRGRHECTPAPPAGPSPGRP